MMGNACFGKSRRSSKATTVVHPLDHHHHRRRVGDEGEGGVRRLKVRMTSGQLKELMAELKKEDSSKGLSDSELGRLVFRECLKGRLHARLVAQSTTGEDCSDHLTTFTSSGKSLSTIQELSDDDDEDHHDRSKADTEEGNIHSSDETTAHQHSLKEAPETESGSPEERQRHKGPKQLEHKILDSKQNPTN